MSTPLIVELTPRKIAEGVKAWMRQHPDDFCKAAVDASELANPDNRTLPANFWKIIKEHKGLEQGLKHVNHRLDCGQADGRLLIIEQKRITAYALLIRLVSLLKRPRRWLQHDTNACLADTDHGEIIKACQCFCTMIGASCYVVYYYDRTLNRCAFLHSEGLKYPETMCGISWRNDPPRQILMNDEGGPWYQAYDDTDIDGIEPRSSFREREGIKMTWGFQLRWHRCRVALFANWRENEHPSFDGAQITSNDFRPAVRYLGGWLAISRNDIRGHGVYLPINPTTIVRLIAAAVEKVSKEEIAEALRLTIEVALDISSGQASLSVHWVEESELVFQEGSYPGYDKPPRFQLMSPGAGMVKKSISAWSAACRVPVLITDLKAADCNVWRELDVPHRISNSEEGWATRSEMVIPIRAHKDRIKGVVCVEHSQPRKFQADHVRRVELITSVFSQLITLKESGQDNLFWPFVQRLTAAHLPNADSLLRNVCCWIVENKELGLQPDLAYVLTYSQTVGVLRPLGVSTSNAFRETYNAAERDGETPSRKVFEDALRPWLMPKPQGKTETMFIEAQPSARGWDTKAEKEGTMSELTEKYFRTAVAVPIVSEQAASPDGVLWLRWMKPYGDQSPADVAASIDELLRPLLSVVAPLYCLFRFCGKEDRTMNGPLGEL